MKGDVQGLDQAVSLVSSLEMSRYRSTEICYKRTASVLLYYSLMRTGHRRIPRLGKQEFPSIVTNGVSVSTQDLLTYMSDICDFNGIACHFLIGCLAHRPQAWIGEAALYTIRGDINPL